MALVPLDILVPVILHIVVAIRDVLMLVLDIDKLG